MYVLGLKCRGHDTGAALITDRSGRLEVAAISEARLNRRKHSYTFPLLSIAYVMERFGLRALDEIDLICLDKHIELWPEPHSQYGLRDAKRDPADKYDRNFRLNYLIEQSIRFPKDRMRWVSHIDCHAASTYYASGYDSAAVLSLEGGIGLFLGDGDKLTVVDKCGYRGPDVRRQKVERVIGRESMNIAHVYTTVTRKLGLDNFAAGKTMALAAFASRFEEKNGLEIPVGRLRTDPMADYTDVVAAIEDTVPAFVPTSRQTADQELISEYWVNLSRQAQTALEESIFEFVKYAYEASGRRKHLCLAGGVALSCVTNRKILDLGLFQHLFVQPAASDEGIPLGAALLEYHRHQNRPARWTMQHAYLGKTNDRADLEATLDKWGFSYRKTTSQEVAGLLAEGKIIGRLTGGSEYGPRALGNRSILADPRIPNMMEVINSRIKHRERFRPFAPSCHEDKQHRYFDVPVSSPFMLLACKVKPDYVDKIPAVIHVDGSSRVQTVNPQQNAPYYELIQAFGDITGIYVLLNTSFNDDGEPIVENYEDALLSFLRTGLDYLFVDDLLVERQADPDRQLRQRLTDAIRERTATWYEREIQHLCDVERYNELSRTIDALPLEDALAMERRWYRAPDTGSGTGQLVPPSTLAEANQDPSNTAAFEI